jgi:phage tail-like protein
MSERSKSEGVTESDQTNVTLSRRTLIGTAAAGSVSLAAATLGSVLPAKVQAQAPPPAEGCFFALEIEGFISASFAFADGLGSQTLPHNDETGIVKLPGRTKWGDIELKRGVDTDKSLYEWRRMVEEGDIANARKNGTVTLLGESRTPIARWTFENAWPSKLTVSGSADRPCGWETIVLHVDLVTRVR